MNDSSNLLASINDRLGSIALKLGAEPAGQDIKPDGSWLNSLIEYHRKTAHGD